MKIMYFDICGDLFHWGHAISCKWAKELGDVLYVGVHSDKTIESYKRTPIMNMEERIAITEACRYVDKVIPDAPLILTREFLEKHNITNVVQSPRTPGEMATWYKVPNEMGIMLEIPRPDISTTRIIQRVIENYADVEYPYITGTPPVLD